MSFWEANLPLKTEEQKLGTQYDKIMGARPMARLIQEKIKKLLAEELLFGRLVGGGHVLVSADDKELTVEVEDQEAAPAVS